MCSCYHVNTYHDNNKNNSNTAIFADNRPANGSFNALM